MQGEGREGAYFRGAGGGAGGVNLLPSYWLATHLERQLLQEVMLVLLQQSPRGRDVVILHRTTVVVLHLKGWVVRGAGDRR